MPEPKKEQKRDPQRHGDNFDQPRRDQKREPQRNPRAPGEPQNRPPQRNPRDQEVDG